MIVKDIKNRITNMFVIETIETEEEEDINISIISDSSNKKYWQITPRNVKNTENFINDFLKIIGSKCKARIIGYEE